MTDGLNGVVHEQHRAILRERRAHSESTPCPSSMIVTSNPAPITLEGRRDRDRPVEQVDLAGRDTDRVDVHIAGTAAVHRNIGIGHDNGVTERALARIAGSR